MIAASIFDDVFTATRTFLHDFTSSKLFYVRLRCLARLLQPLMFTYETHNGVKAAVAQPKTAVTGTINLLIWREQRVPLEPPPLCELPLQRTDVLVQGA